MGVNNAPPRSVMLSIAALAERDGVSKPAVSRKVKQLASGHGLTVERDERGRVAGVNVAEYDELRGRFGDPSKIQSPPPPNAPVPTNETYDEALRQRTWTEAERSRIRLAAERRELISREGTIAALAQCGEEIGRTIDRLAGAADELAVAVAKDGVHGLRVAIKQITFRMKGEVANSLAAVADSTPGEPAPAESISPDETSA